VVGSANVDIVVEADRLPAPGETVLGGDRKEYWGGKGANQAVAALRAGAEVRFVSATGSDRYGAAYRKRLAAEGIQRRGLIAVPGPTGGALIVVDPSGKNQIAVSPGANARLTPRRISERRGVLDFGDVILAQLEIPAATVAAAFRRARRRGAATVLNPAPAPDSLPAGLLSLVDVLVPNETEAARLAGRKRPPGAAALVRLCRTLRARGPGAVVLTAGEAGALVSGEEGTVWVRPPGGIRALDTTGAGDVFAGALAASLAGGAALSDAARFAVAAASLSVRKRGAQEGIPGRRAILKAIRETRVESVSAG
jgi:ribokinase